MKTAEEYIETVFGTARFAELVKNANTEAIISLMNDIANQAGDYEKNPILAFSDLHQLDINDYGNRLGVCTSLIEANLCKKGTKITMAASHDAINDLASGKRMCVLLLVDKSEYKKILKNE